MQPKRNPVPKLAYSAIVFALFHKGSTPEVPADEVLQLVEEDVEFTGVRCPLCNWRPNASSRWGCADCWYPEHFYGGCGTVWNTFTTRGLCPGCGHQWRWTACLSCSGWSWHEDWYVIEAVKL